MVSHQNIVIFPRRHGQAPASKERPTPGGKPAANTAAPGPRNQARVLDLHHPAQRYAVNWRQNLEAVQAIAPKTCPRPRGQDRFHGAPDRPSPVLLRYGKPPGQMVFDRWRMVS